MRIRIRLVTLMRMRIRIRIQVPKMMLIHNTAYGTVPTFVHVKGGFQVALRLD